MKESPADVVCRCGHSRQNHYSKSRRLACIIEGCSCTDFAVLSVSGWIEKYAGEFAPGYHHPMIHKFNLPRIPPTEQSGYQSLDRPERFLRFRGTATLRDWPDDPLELRRPRHEVYYQPEGVAGAVLASMKARGWSMLTDLSVSESSVEGSTHKISMTGNLELYKNGERRTKADWDRELIQVATELGIFEGDQGEST